MTQAEVLKIARRKIKGAKSLINRRALKPAEREKFVVQRALRKNRLAELKEEQKQHEHSLGPLIKAARFVVDVAGDPPSIDELTVAVESAERKAEILSESRDLKNELFGDSWKVWCKRYEIYADNRLFRTVYASGDTWDAVAESLNGK